MSKRWDTVICVPEAEYRGLVKSNRRLRWLFRLAVVFAMISSAVLSVESRMLTQINASLYETTRDFRELRRHYDRNSTTLAALAKSHAEVLDAKEQINSVGERAWGRRFTITKYTPSAGGINAYGDGKHTATRMKADPAKHIVAVDPTLIPYGSWVWIEDLGWYQAQDCGSMIKGFRLDVMNASLTGSFDYGKQRRFAIVVPPKGAHNA